MELELTKQRFTWSNYRENITYEKYDTVLVSPK
jgi:hypothetical protein